MCIGIKFLLKKKKKKRRDKGMNKREIENKIEGEGREVENR